MADARRRFALLPANQYLGWTPYAWLIYLPTIFVEPATHHASAGTWAATIGLTLVFLVSYFRGYWVGSRGIAPIVAFQVLLGVPWSFHNPGAGTLFVYAASFAAQIERARDAVRTIAAITAIGLVTAYFADVPPFFWLLVGVLAPLIGGVNLHFSQVGRANRRLQLAQTEIAHLATVAERERIARDLHDVLGHTLSLITLKSELASKLVAKDPARAEREMRDVEQVSREAMQEVRDAIRGYRVTLHEELERSRTLLVAAGIDAEVDARPTPPLAPAVEEALSLALREAVTNVVRHAEARRCRIELRHGERAIHLVVQDDGRARGPKPEGSGLRGMRARIETLDGSLTRQSAGGTRIAVTLPLAPTTAADAASEPMVVR